MKFAIGSFVRVIASHAEGQTCGYLYRYDQVNGVEKQVEQYLVRLSGDAIWIDADRLTESAKPATHVFASDYGACLVCGVSQRVAVGTATMPPTPCLPRRPASGPWQS
jgi:hypothetical protein